MNDLSFISGVIHYISVPQYQRRNALSLPFSVTPLSSLIT